MGCDEEPIVARKGVVETVIVTVGVSGCTGEGARGEDACLRTPIACLASRPQGTLLLLWPMHGVSSIAYGV